MSVGSCTEAPAPYGLVTASEDISDACSRLLPMGAVKPVGQPDSLLLDDLWAYGEQGRLTVAQSVSLVSASLRLVVY